MTITKERLDLACRRLLALGVPTDFIYLVLIAWWLMSSELFSWKDIQDCGGLDLVEFFSGVGRIATYAHSCGFVSRAYDINHDPAPEGYSTHSELPKRSSFDMNGEAGMLLCIIMILHGKWPGLITTWAVVCSSWSPVNLATSKRTELNPYGDCNNTKVIRGNRMVARTSLLILLTFVLEGYFFLENPGGSVICLHPRLRWCFAAIRRAGAKVYKAGFHMKAFGSATEKKTMLLTSSRCFRQFHGKKAKRSGTKKGLCRKYIDSKGRTAYAGTKALKLSQVYPVMFAKSIVKLIPQMRSEGSFTFNLPVETGPSLQEALLGAGWTSWDESCLGPCFLYVWGSKFSDVIPPDWKDFDAAAKANFPLGRFRGFTYL
ncbi:unnamed protein product [Durusdinium trenchii]|uniref:Uncharacterized protein n=1 Tax=Durusdinium trenchii TaxID=1381693 RepID=A0ABP0NAK1_9DINO